MLDDGLGGLAGVRGGGQLALEAAGRAGAAAPRRAPTGSSGHASAGAAEQPALAVVDLGLAQDGSSSGRSTPSATMRAPTSRANATVARSTAWRLGSRSTPVTMPRQSLRKSGRISATYSSEVKPAPASSTATARRGRSTAAAARAAADDVLDGVLLGELDHEPRRQLLGELQQAGMAERVGRDVDEQQPAGGRRAGLADGGPAGDLEVVADAEPAGGGERDVRRQRDQAGRRGEAGEALVADGWRSLRRTIGWKTARIAPGSSSSRKSSTRARRRRAWGTRGLPSPSGIGPLEANLRRPGRVSGAPTR